MSTIPANLFVNVTPSVLGAGGNALDVIGLLLTNSTRAPIGTVQSFPNAASVGTYFGAGSQEASLAGVYFSGFTGANKSPGSILFAQYNQGAVSAYMRGGNVSALTLAQLQAISGSLNVTVDGYPRNAASVNLSAAASFSAAATAIQTALNAGGANPAVATMTAAIAAGAGASFTASIAGQLMTVSAMTSGTIQIGGILAGGTVLANTAITGQVSGTAGGVGVYSVNLSQTVASGALTESWGLMTVTAVLTGAFAVGQTLSGTGVTVGSLLTALGTGTGGTGTYIVNLTQTASSTTISGTGTAVAVTYDSVSGGFVITSGIVGAPSSIAFATGTIAATLALTLATGAVLSQGAAAAVPAAFMNALVALNDDWVMFMTLTDPDSGSGNTIKQAFAAWKNTQNNAFAYICWDTDITPTNTLPASLSLGAILAGNQDSGTCLLDGDPAAGWNATAGAQLAAFVCGAGAAIDFTQTKGRITFAYKWQAGLTPTVTTATIATNLGGSPQSANRGNGYNYGGAVGAANAGFSWFQRGFVTGPFSFLDSYINQVWLNNAFQIALLNLLNNAKSISYDTAGNALIAQALADPIAAGLNFGAFSPGAISALQIAEVNAAAGTNIANTLQTQGFYLQILPASSTVRAARGSPPMTFWYLDRGSIQALNLASIAVQ